MSIIKFNKDLKRQVTTNDSAVKTKEKSDVISFKKKDIPDFVPVTEEPIFGTMWPMGQFIITNIPGMGHYATLIIEEK